VVIVYTQQLVGRERIFSLAAVVGVEVAVVKVVAVVYKQIIICCINLTNPV